MERPPDIAAVLQHWPYDEKHPTRVVKLEDGRHVLQVRLPFGVEQYERDGRPDGERPHGFDSALAFFIDKRARHTATSGDRPFTLNHAECRELFEEGKMYYYRYLRFFELQDWERTARDTARNIRLFDFVKDYAGEQGDRLHLEQWRPYIIRINSVARLMMKLEKDDYAAAYRIVNDAMIRISNLPELDSVTFEYERERSLDALGEARQCIRSSKPMAEREKLERELRKAVKAEEFERAAELRDRISDLAGETADSAARS